jgi:hypothetical protein
MDATEWVGDEASARRRDAQESAERLKHAIEDAAQEKQWRILTQQELAEARAELAAEREWKANPETAQFRAGMLAAAAELDKMRARCSDFEDRERYLQQARAIRVTRLEKGTVDG